MEDVAFVNLLRIASHVLGFVEGGGESPDGTDHFAGAVSFVDSPEIVGVVEEVGHRQALGKIVGPIHHDIGRRIGGTTDHAIFSGVLAKFPGKGEGHADFGVAVSRERIGNRFRKRDFIHVDVQGELIAGRRSHQVIFTGGERHVIDVGGNGSVVATKALEQGNRTAGTGVHAVCHVHVIGTAVLIPVSHCIETGSLGSPVDGAVPSAVVSLDKDQQVAGAVPCECALVEHEFVPADDGRDIALVHQGHAVNGVGGGGQSLVRYVGHPDGDVLLLIAILVRGIIADAAHRGSRHAGFHQLVGVEEVLGNGVVVKGVEGGVTSRASSIRFTDLCFVGSASATATGIAGVVVVGTRTGLAIEVGKVECHLTVGTSHLGVEKHIVFDFQFVNHILAIRFITRKQVVVVDVGTKGGRERLGSCGSRLHHVGHDRIVGRRGDVESVSQTAVGPHNEFCAVGASRGVGIIDGEIERFGRVDHGRQVRIDNEEILIRGFDRCNGLSCA